MITEIGSGLLMILGLATSLAAAGFVGLMVVAAVTDHRDKGFFVFKGGWEYVAFIAVAAVALACLGPGAWSLDRLAGLTVSGPRWSIASLVAGLGGALLLLKTGRRTVVQRSASNEA